MTLIFDAATHEYRVDGRVVPSVSTVVRGLFPMRFAVDPWCMERGTMVHRACALLVRRELDWASIDERILGYVKAAQAFLVVRPEWPDAAAVEQPRGCSLFAGTPDLMVGGTVIDWKTWDDPCVEIQLGGYCVLTKARRACAVELRENGTFVRTDYDARRAAGLFMAALSLYGWAAAHGQLAKAQKGDDDDGRVAGSADQE